MVGEIQYISKITAWSPINQLVTNGLSHPYHLDQSIHNFRDVRSKLFHFYFIVDENQVSKQNSPRWDVAFFGVTSRSGAILFAYVP